MFITLSCVSSRSSIMSFSYLFMQLEAGQPFFWIIVSVLLPQCVRNVNKTFIVCSLFIHYFVNCSSFVIHCLFVVCSSFIVHCSVSSLLVHRSFSIRCSFVRSFVLSFFIHRCSFVYRLFIYHRGPLCPPPLFHRHLLPLLIVECRICYFWGRWCCCRCKIRRHWRCIAS